MDKEVVSGLLAGGEGQKTEFKRTFAEADEAIRSLCAFANASDGTLIFGVRDDGHLVNPEIGKNTLEEFANKLKQNTQPPLTPEVSVLTIDGSQVAVAQTRGHQKGELFMAFGQALIRVGKTNQVMSPTEMKARLSESFTDWSEERDRPRFAVSMSGASRNETEYTPGFNVRHTGGDKIRSIEWRVRGPRFQGLSWRPTEVASLERTHFAAKFNLSVQPVTDDVVEIDQMGFEIRFVWRGRERHELHLWPIRRRELPGKVLWDAGSPLQPSEWDEQISPEKGR